MSLADMFEQHRQAVAKEAEALKAYNDAEKAFADFRAANPVTYETSGGTVDVNDEDMVSLVDDMAPRAIVEAQSRRSQEADRVALPNGWESHPKEQRDRDWARGLEMHKEAKRVFQADLESRTDGLRRYYQHPLHEAEVAAADVLEDAENHEREIWWNIINAPCGTAAEASQKVEYLLAEGKLTERVADLDDGDSLAGFLRSLVGGSEART